MEPILKNHVMGGLDCGNNLVTQDPNSYKDMSNTIQDVDGVYRTLNGYEQDGADIGTAFEPLELHNLNYDGGNRIICIGDDSGDAYLYDPDPADLPHATLIKSQSSKTILFDGAQHSFTELNRVLYFKSLDGSDWLKKYDGIKWHNAGLPQAAIDGSATVGTQYSRSFYITVDFQGNECIGEYTQKRFTPAAGNITINPTKAGSASPQAPYDGNYLDYGFDDKFIQWSVAPGNVSYNAGSDQLTLTVTNHNVESGDWMMIGWGLSPLTVATMSVTRFNQKASGQESFSFIAMKVVSTTPTTVVFDVSAATSLVYVDKLKWMTAATYISRNSNMSTAIWDSFWSDANITSGAEPIISNVYLATFTSTSATSGFILRSLSAVAYLGSSYSITTSTTATTGPNPFRSIPDSGADNWVQSFSFDTVDIQDVIDDTVAKSIFPRSANFLTKYAGLLICAENNVINFSDSSLNASPELYRPAQSFQPGNWEDGSIQGVCGGEDHLLIARRQNNYSLTGNLATLNIQVSRYSQAVPGGFHNTMIAIGDSVLFMCPWGIYSSGTTGLEAIGKQVRDFFRKEGQKHFDAVFTTQDITASNDYKVSFDYERGLVAWYGVIGTGVGALVFNLRTGNWHKLAGFKPQDLHFIDGEYYCVANDENKLFKEVALLTTMDGVDTESYLQTPWLVLGEPSIEKMFKQLKVYARSSTVLNVKAFWNWDETTVRMNSDMTIADLANKIRIDANKVQAISLRISPPAGEFMEIEAMEIEYGGIQEGMKK